MNKQIVWRDLPKRYSLFTRCSTNMISLDDGKVLAYYSANTKLNFVQVTTIDGEHYFRTETAKESGLNWAVKASAFELSKDELASLEPSNHTLNTLTPKNSVRINKNPPKISEQPKSEVAISEDKKMSIISAFKRFFRRK